MAGIKEQFDHRYLNCGIELGVLPIAGRPIVAIEIRLFAGYAYEDSEYLGVARVMEEAISKGTARHDGRRINGALGEILSCFIGHHLFEIPIAGGYLHAETESNIAEWVRLRF